MKNSTIDGLLSLKPEEIKIIYWRCRGETVEQTAKKVGPATSTVYKILSDEIYPALDVEGWDDLKTEVCRPLLGMVDKLEDLDTWPEGYREKLESLRGTVENPKPSPSQQTPQIPPTQPGQGRQVPWHLIAIPIFVFCLLCFAGGVFAWSRLTTFFAIDNTITPSVLKSPESIIESTFTVEASSTVVPTDTETPLPTDTESPTQTPTSTDTPLPSDTPTPSPIPTVPPLFFDDFTNGKSDTWQILYGNPLIVNNALTFDETTLMAIGEQWNDVEVSFDVSNMSCQESVSSRGVTVALRYQDPNNMVGLRIFQGNNCRAVWFLIKDGNWNRMPSSDFPLPPRDNEGVRHIVLNVQGNVYSSPLGTSVVIENYPTGGVSLLANRNVIIDNFKVAPLTFP